MVYTIGSSLLIEDAVYTIRTTLKDFMTEQVRKVFKVSNFGADTNVQAAMRVFESATNAGLMTNSGSIDLDISGASTSITSSGQHFALVNDVLYLGFSQVHPLNPAKTIKALFGIPAPVDAIVDQVTNIGKPVMDRGIDFATAANINEALGALVDWLEDSLTYLDVAGTLHVGGWTYSDALSGLITNAGIIDGSDLT